MNRRGFLSLIAVPVVAAVPMPRIADTAAAPISLTAMRYADRALLQFNGTTQQAAIMQALFAAFCEGMPEGDRPLKVEWRKGEQIQVWK